MQGRDGWLRCRLCEVCWLSTLANAFKCVRSKVTKNNFRSILKRLTKQGIQPKTYRNIYDHTYPTLPSSQDWGEAMDVSVFMDALRN